MGIKAQAVRASYWTVGGYGVGQALRLVSHLILAWLLVPEIFGLMTLVRVLLIGLNMFSDVGIGPSVIQNPRGNESRFLETAWTIQIIRGFILWGATWVLAWPFAEAFAGSGPEARELASILPVVGVTAVFNGFNSTVIFSLNRELRLGRLTVLELSTQALSLVVMVGWALMSPTIWAMVGGGVAGSVYRMIASHVIVRGARMRVGWDSTCARELIRFGRWIFLSTVFSYLALNLDRLILAKVLTLAELGLYGISFVLGMVALQVSNRLGGTVLFPVFSRYQHDPHKMAEIALRAREVILGVGLAVCASMAVGSRLFFETLWDKPYHGAAEIAQVMPLYIWSMITLETIDRIPLALGDSRALFLTNVIRTVGTGFAVGGYALGGVQGFLVGLSLAPIAAEVYVLLKIPVGRRGFALQAARFSLLGVSYTLPAVVFVNALHAGPGPLYVSCVVLLAGLPLLGAFRVVRRAAV